MGLLDLLLCTCGHPRHSHEEVYAPSIYGRPMLHYAACMDDGCDCRMFLERHRLTLYEPKDPTAAVPLVADEPARKSRKTEEGCPDARRRPNPDAISAALDRRADGCERAAPHPGG